MDNLHRSDGWLDLPLSDKGRMGLIPPQQYLKLEPLASIHAAPLRRTQETAHIVQSGILCSPDVRICKEAMTWDLGVLAGMHKKETKPKVRHLIDNPGEAPTGGESHGAFAGRFMPWFDARVREAKAKDKPILIIGSGSNLRLLGIELFGDKDAFNLGEGGLVKLWEEGGKWCKEIIFEGGKDAQYES